MLAPLISCLKDPDSKIRFYACESLYNVIKSLRDIALIEFNEIFDALIDVVADPDEEVRRAAQTIDRLLKDVISEASNSR